MDDALPSLWDKLIFIKRMFGNWVEFENLSFYLNLTVSMQYRSLLFRYIQICDNSIYILHNSAGYTYIHIYIYAYVYIFTYKYLFNWKN